MCLLDPSTTSIDFVQSTEDSLLVSFERQDYSQDGTIKDDSKAKPKLELSSHDMKRKKSRDRGYAS